MSSYCCFLDPDRNYEDRSKEDLCPKCGKPYGFPLSDFPKQIDKYRILEPLDRGFYSVAYIAEVTTPFGTTTKRVIKVAPKLIYDDFKKDFDDECRVHYQAGEGSHHIVQIHDKKLDVDVQFGDVVIPCHIAELDYVNGIPLSKYLWSGEPISAIDIAQIAMDLFALMDELQSKEVFHNDLHPGNLIIQQLDKTNKRADAESQFVNLVAIDLNSMADKSKSSENRLGDLRWVVKHLRLLVDRLIHPDKTEELDFRLARVLEEQAYLLSPDATAQRTPGFDECIDSIRKAIRQTRAPWIETLQLRKFSDAYNAQTLDPWFVPYLLIDPDKQWLSAISVKGPQIITGMRGCGKTMLLKALDFHARATAHKNGGNTDVKERLRNDGYVGIYVSSTKLLEIEGTEVRYPIEKIFLAYAIEALRAFNHLREIDNNAVFPGAYLLIGKAISEYLRGAEYLANTASEFGLESALLNVMVKLNRGEGDYRVDGNPAIVFQHLAETISNCSPIWQNATIFFLLDDVSTRYLSKLNIQKLLSSLIFSQPKCAFKITTEAQTLPLILQSPGLVEKARVGRDYEVFDLGAEVNELTRKKNGIKFIEDVLMQRSKYYPQSNIKGMRARELLGDTSLQSIALSIGKAAETSSRRKQVYFGITALTHSCVGDIGDVIRIYETMLNKTRNKQFPISPKIQTQCYHDFCSARMHDLNRNNSWLKDHALTFAQASYDLLMQSYKDYVAKGNKGRIRQYLKIYIRNTVGNTDKQLEQIRQLIDAGVFVLDGGAYRKKTKDSDPVQQFILTFRKLYGLSNFIGLSERDRFELSGADLASWLKKPNKKILKRNLEREDLQSGEAEKDVGYEEEGVTDEIGEGQTLQPTLWDEPTIKQPEAETHHEKSIAFLIKDKLPICQQVNESDLSAHAIDTIVLGLGFEARTLASAKRILSIIKPQRAICFKHKEQGRSGEILKLVKKYVKTSYVMTSEEFLQSTEAQLRGKVMVDVTGLSKAMLFHSVRNAALNNGRVLVCHTKAQEYYPLDDDIAEVLKARSEGDYYVLLEAMSKILTGEKKPYSLDPLLSSDADNTRRRLLFAFASAKHERLLWLLDNRDYDNVQLVTQNTKSSRGKLAHLSAEFAAQNYQNTELLELRTDDLTGAIQEIMKSYHYWYVDKGFNYEIGLTGSKLQAVASAIVSAIFKFSQCWYVRPQEFDSKRFTKGVGETRYFEILLP
jgi:hypothetical protein